MKFSYVFDEYDALRFYEWLDHRPDEYTEIRAIQWLPDKQKGRTEIQFVNNNRDFLKYCRKYTEEPEYAGHYHIYAGVNPRQYDHDTENEGKTIKKGSSENINRVTVIPFDIDSPHPKDEAATQEELKEAKETLEKTSEWIKEQGFTQVYIDHTGNGYRVLQAVNIGLNNENREKVQSLLHTYHEELAYNCKHNKATFDKITDLPRIVKVPGTWSVKGENTESRPHRRAKIINIPQREPKDEALHRHLKNIKLPELGKDNPTDAPLPNKVKKMRPCFRRFITQGNRASTLEDRTDETTMRFAVIEEAWANGIHDRDEIVNLFQKADDFNRDVTRREVDKKITEIKLNGNRPYRCIKIHVHGACLGPDCELYKNNVLTKHKEKTETVNMVITHEGSTQLLIKAQEMYDKDQFIAPRLADEILVLTPSDYLLTPVSENGGDIIYRYQDQEGIYKPNGIAWIETQVTRILNEDASISKINEVTNLVKIKTYDFDHKLDKEDPYAVVLDNCVYNIETREYHPYSPSYRSKNRLPVIYDAEAQCPNIIQFIKEIANPKDINVLQEWIGYHLLKDYRYQKCCMLIGAGSNGKSTFLRVLEIFLGKENVSNIGLYQLTSNRFATSELHGKLANIAPDISNDELKRTGIFKALTGGDTIRAERKHQNAFYFLNYAKLNFSANHLPISEDRSHAFFRRWLLLQFDNTFEGDTADENILNKLTTPEELSGLLNWALEGLYRLMEQGEFSTSETTEQLRKRFEEQADPVKGFVSNCTIEDVTAEIPKDNIYQAYYKYSVMKGLQPKSDNKFAEALNREIDFLKDSRPTIDGKRVKCWKGFTLLCGKTEACQGCQACQGTSNFLPTKIRQPPLERSYNSPDSLAYPDSKLSLGEKIEKIYSIFESLNECKKDDVFSEAIKIGISINEVNKIIPILEREKRIYQPRIGAWRACK